MPGLTFPRQNPAKCHRHVFHLDAIHLDPSPRHFFIEETFHTSRARILGKTFRARLVFRIEIGRGISGDHRSEGKKVIAVFGEFSRGLARASMRTSAFSRKAREWLSTGSPSSFQKGETSAKSTPRNTAEMFRLMWLHLSCRRLPFFRHPESSKRDTASSRSNTSRSSPGVPPEKRQEVETPRREEKPRSRYSYTLVAP